MKLEPTYAAVGEDTIHGYRQSTAVLKSRFLRDASRFLRAIRDLVARHQWECEITQNKGGLAVSGEVYLVIWKTGNKHSLFVQIGATFGARKAQNGSGRDSDGVLILVQRRQRDPLTGHTHAYAPNIYWDANMDSSEAATRVLGLLSEMA